jgi:alpha-tubulin suppressor-like RCC1 family protein
LRSKALFFSILSSLVVLILFQNCSGVSFSNIPQGVYANSESNDNGKPYDGKLITLYHYVEGFQCDGKSQPESILTQVDAARWSLMRNTAEKCSAATGIPVKNVIFDSSINQAVFEGKIYELPRIDFENYSSGLKDLAIDIAAGSSETCIVHSSGVLKCWGSNTYGSIGDGTKVSSPLPIVIDPGTRYSQVVTGNGPNTCGLMQNGGVKCWGWNLGGQLGDGTFSQRLSPVSSDGGTKYLAISAGGPHVCGITGTNSLRCWGYNQSGQLGDGTTTSRASGVTIDNGTVYQQVSVGGEHTCATSSQGLLKCWGSNSSGQLGDGTLTNRLLPTPIDSGTAYISVGSGRSHTCGITSSGTLKCWGSNSYGELGDGTLTDHALPTVIDPGVSYALISMSASGLGRSCGITTGGILKCWGAAFIGDGTSSQSLLPTVVDPGTSYLKISNGFQHACGLTTLGIVKCWGANYDGELGSAPSPQLSPISFQSLLGL